MTARMILVALDLERLMEAAETEHAAAQHAGDFDQAMRWAGLRDAVIELLYEREAA